MGFLDGLGRTVTNAAKEGLRGGVIDGFLNGMGNSAATGKAGYSDYIYDANGNIKGVSKEATERVADLYDSGLIGTTREDSLNTFYSNYLQTQGININNSNAPDPNIQSDAKMQKVSYSNFDGPHQTISDRSFLKMPNWGYADFINERAIWQKQIGNAFNDPAWFYFKIFFDFDSNHGLLGGIMNQTNVKETENCALRYLMSSTRMYNDEVLSTRIEALRKFTKILSYICTSAPWFFKGVRGLDKLSIPSIKDFSTEKYIEIDLMPDAIDMRLTNLMSLYKYACYDDYNHKEIIPENLRQFNMSIVIFQTPLRYLHTSYSSQKSINFMGLDSNQLGLSNLLNMGNSSNEKVKYKTLNTQDIANTMSFKIYTLYGCEFDMESFATIMKGDVSNEEPFQLGNNSIKIKYVSSLEHTMNEFYEMMYGSNGFFFNNYSEYQTVNNDDAFNVNAKAHQKQLERYQALIDTFGTPGTGGTILGLVNSPKTYQHAVDASEALLNGMFNDNDLLGDLGSNFILGLLGSSKSATTAPQGNLYGDFGIGSAYFKDKLEMLKNGIHENTMPPHYYDPERGIVYERGKPANEYSAYSYYNMKTDINNFDLGNWLNNATTSLGQTVNDQIRSLASGSNKQYIEGAPHMMNIKDPYVYNPNNAVNKDDLNEFKHGDKPNTDKPKENDERLNEIKFKNELKDFKVGDKPHTERPKETDSNLHTEKFKNEIKDFKLGDKPHTEKPKETDNNLHTEKFKNEIKDFKLGDKPHTEKPKETDTNLNTKKFISELNEFKNGDKPHTEKPKDADTRLHTQEFKHETNNFKYADKPNTEHHKDADTRLHTQEFAKEITDFKYADKPNTEHHKDADTRLHTEKFKNEIKDFKLGDKTNTEKPKEIDTNLNTKKFISGLNEFKNGDKPHTEYPKTNDDNIQTLKFKQNLENFKHGNKLNTERPKEIDSNLHTEKFKNEINDFKYGDKPNTEHHKNEDTRLHTNEFIKEVQDFKESPRNLTMDPHNEDTRLHTVDFFKEVRKFKEDNRQNTENPKTIDTRLHTNEFKDDLHEFKNGIKDNVENAKHEDTRLNTDAFKRSLESFKNGVKPNTQEQYKYSSGDVIVGNLEGSPDNVTKPYIYDNSDKNYQIKNLYDYLNYDLENIDETYNTNNGDVRKPYLYDIVNPKADETWRTPHPLATDASDPDKSPKLDSLTEREKEYRNMNYLNDGEGAEEKNLETPETRKPYKYENENPNALESWRTSNQYDVGFAPGTNYSDLDSIALKENEYKNQIDQRGRLNHYDYDENTRKPYKYEIENPKAEENWRQAHPLDKSNTYKDSSIKLDSLKLRENEYRNRNYLNDGEGTELNDLLNTETMPPFKYDPINAVKYESNKAKKNGNS